MQKSNFFSVDKGIPACLSFYRILLEAKKIQNLCSMPQIQFWTHLRLQNRYLIINGFSFQPFDTRIAQLTCLIIFQSSMFMTSIKRAKKLATKCQAVVLFPDQFDGVMSKYFLHILKIRKPEMHYGCYQWHNQVSRYTLRSFNCFSR